MPKRRSSTCDSDTPAFDHGLAHHLRLPRERQRVPCNVAARNRVFHRLAVRRRGLFQVLVEQPRSCGPHVAALALGICRPRHLDRPRKIFREIFPHHVGLCIDKPGVKVALEHHQHAAHAKIRLRVVCAQRHARSRRQQQTGSGRRHRLHKIAALHARHRNPPIRSGVYHSSPRASAPAIRSRHEIASSQMVETSTESAGQPRPVPGARSDFTAPPKMP